MTSSAPHFDGSTYEPDEDHNRLTRQLARVRTLMLDGRWRTLKQIAARTHDPESSVSARLRDLRKQRFGAYLVNRRRRERGLFEYQLREQPPQRDLFS